MMPTSGDENQPNMLTVPSGAIVVQFSVKNAKTLFTVLGAGMLLLFWHWQETGVWIYLCKNKSDEMQM